MQSAARLAACRWVVERHHHMHAAAGGFCNDEDIKKDAGAVQRNGFARITKKNAFAHFKAVLEFRERHAQEFAVHGGPCARCPNACKLIGATNDVHTPFVIKRQFNIRSHRAGNAQRTKSAQQRNELQWKFSNR